MSFLDLTAELTGVLPGISPLLSRKFINRAWLKIQSERLWSFLTVDGVVICPGQITAGTASITQYSATVTLDATASAALLTQANATTEPGLTNMAIRFGATSPAAGQIYSISEADVTNPAAIVLTLDRMCVEATDTAAGYQCYRPYIVPPYSDFLKWESLTDMANAFSITNDRLNRTSKEFDRKDPQRQAQGLAYFLGNYLGSYIPDPVSGTVVPNPNVEYGSNTYELWPHPTQGQTFYAKFRRSGTGFTQPGDTQPSVIPDELIMHRALGWYAYPFAQANVSNFPTFKGANWPSLILQSRAAYTETLTDTKRQDEEAAPQNIFARGHGLRVGTGDFKGISDYPIDSNYLQAHLVRF